LFHFDSETVSGIGGLCFECDDWQRLSTFFRKKVHPVRIFWPDWPRKNLAPLLRWRLHLMACLTTLVIWKWPGCLDVLAPTLIATCFSYHHHHHHRHHYNKTPVTLQPREVSECLVLLSRGTYMTLYTGTWLRDSTEHELDDVMTLLFISLNRYSVIVT